jgi:glycosyltransferase involved in cell wall biosynthesis
VLLHKENGGLSSSRNFAMPHAKGEYIGFVDSDDFVEQNMFEEMYNKAKEEDLDFVECDFSWDFPKKTKIDKGYNYINKTSFFENGRVMACNKIYKTKILTQNNIKFPEGLKYEDIEFFYKLIPFIKKSNIINLPFYHYVQRENSLINNQDEKNNDIFIILNNILEFYKSNNLYKNYELELEFLYIRFLLGSSFLRIVKIDNKYVRKELLKKTIFELYNKFPYWKVNYILINNKTRKKYYYNSVNRFTYKIYSKVFRLKSVNHLITN